MQFLSPEIIIIVITIRIKSHSFVVVKTDINIIAFSEKHIPLAVFTVFHS